MPGVVVVGVVVGGAGGVTTPAVGRTALLGVENGPVPTVLTAATRNATLTPFARGFTSSDVVLPVTGLPAAAVHDAPASKLCCTTYPVSGLPPFDPGAVHDTRACASPAAALTPVGAPGTDAATVTALVVVNALATPPGGLFVAVYWATRVTFPGTVGVHTSVATPPATGAAPSGKISSVRNSTDPAAVAGVSIARSVTGTPTDTTADTSNATVAHATTGTVRTPSTIVHPAGRIGGTPAAGTEFGRRSRRSRDPRPSRRPQRRPSGWLRTGLPERRWRRSG